MIDTPEGKAKKVYKIKPKAGEKGRKKGRKSRAKIRHSMIGNTNAQKYTRDDVFVLFNKMIAEAQKLEDKLDQDGNVVCQIPKHQFYGGVYIECKTHTDQVRDWLKRFPDDKELHGLIKIVKSICEYNCFTCGSKGITKESMSKFCLSAKHRWSEKVDHTSNGNTINYVGFQDSIKSPTDAIDAQDE